MTREERKKNLTKALHKIYLLGWSLVVLFSYSAIHWHLVVTLALLVVLIAFVHYGGECETQLKKQLKRLNK